MYPMCTGLSSIELLRASRYFVETGTDVSFRPLRRPGKIDAPTLDLSASRDSQGFKLIFSYKILTRGISFSDEISVVV